MHADTNLQLMFAAALGVLARDEILEVDERPRCCIGAREREESLIPDLLHYPPLLERQAFAEQIKVQLLELSPGRVAKPREIRRRTDDVGERQHHGTLEPARQLLLKQVLQPDNLRHAERAEIHHGRHTISRGL